MFVLAVVVLTRTLPLEFIRIASAIAPPEVDVAIAKYPAKLLEVEFSFAPFNVANAQGSNAPAEPFIPPIPIVPPLSVD